MCIRDRVVFTADDAVEWNEKGEKVVLVRLETSPEDITGMKASQGILTVRGGIDVYKRQHQDSTAVKSFCN